MEYVYAALLLHKLGKPVDEKNLQSVLKASGAEIDEAKVKSLIASLKDLDIDAELANAIAMSASAAPAASGGAPAPAEEPKEEKKAEESAAGLSALFG